MSVIIKLNGILIGITKMSESEIKKAESEGFTIITAQKGE